MRHFLTTSRVDRYFASGLGARAEAAMRSHLAGCAACGLRYERHLRLEAALPGGDGLGEARLWRSIERGTRERPRRAVVFVPLVLAGAVAGLAVVVGPRLREHRPAALERGMPAAAAAPSIHLYRVDRPGHAEAVTDRIAASDGLAVAYSNPGRDHRWLMVFAVDERFGVHWLYPPFERPGEDPEAVAIAPERTGVELGEEIHLPLPPGRARIYALFLARPERVAAIEARVAREIAARGLSLDEEASLAGAGGTQQSQLVRVTP